MYGLLITVLALTTVRGVSVPLIEQPGAFGEEATEAAIQAVQRTCIFKNDAQFLRRLAWVVSRFGASDDSSPCCRMGGIWRLEEKTFRQTQDELNDRKYDQIQQAVRQYLGVDYSRLSYQNGDLRKPLNSALAASVLIFLRETRAAWNIGRQAQSFKRYYHSDDDISQQDFENLAGNMTDRCPSMGADVLFLVDGTVLEALQDIEKIKTFITQTVSALDATGGQFRFSVVTYSTEIIGESEFADRRSLNEFRRDMDSIKFFAVGARNTYSAMSVVRQRMFNTPRDSEFIFPKVVVLLTGGQAFDNETALEGLEPDERLHVFTVGYGGRRENYLLALTTSPSCMLQHGFKSLNSIPDELARDIGVQICNFHAEASFNNVDEPVVTNGSLARTAYAFMTFHVEVEKRVTFTLTNVLGESVAYFSVKGFSPNANQHDQQLSSGSLTLTSKSLPTDFTNSSKTVIRVAVRGVENGNNVYSLRVETDVLQHSALSAVSATSVLSGFVLTASLTAMLSRIV